MMQSRPPAVAGSFYPGVPAALDQMVDSMLSAVEAPPEGAPAPKALIVPHAGYVYSGPVAASAYAQVCRLREGIRRVVVLGPAHRVAVRGLAAPEAPAFDTPLGTIPIDHDALATLRDLPQVVVSEQAHALEHSLEVQLPFLQHVLGDFSLVPLVVGRATDAEVAEVIDRLWGGDETLFVISSDLSHYYDYETARRMDAESCRAIEAMDGDALDEESACGRVPVRGMLRAARRRGLEVRTLDLRSSGDTAGPRDQVVGYGAWALTPPSSDAQRDSDDRPGAPVEAGQPGPIDEADARRLLELARESIAAGLEMGSEPRLDADRSNLSPALAETGACFVTLRSPDGELRGCIGSLEATRPLAEDVVGNAWAAATRDPRMQPVTRAELPSLRIEISVLGPLEPIEADSFDAVVGQLRPGRDGLVLEDGRARGTLLPSVWEQEPEPRAFAGLVWRKAGLSPRHWSPTARAWRYGVQMLGPA